MFFLIRNIAADFADYADLFNTKSMTRASQRSAASQSSEDAKFLDLERVLLRIQAEYRAEKAACQYLAPSLQ